MSDRPFRICDVCGQVDDHPRHEFLSAPGEFPVNEEHLAAVIGRDDLSPERRASVAREVVNTGLQQRHMDCCRAAGCPDRSCDAIAASGAEGLTGAKLVKHLTSGAVDHILDEKTGA